MQLSEQLVLSLLRSSNVIQALEKTRQFINDTPNNHLYCYLHGLSLMANDQIDDSIHYLKKAIKLNSHNSIYHCNLGVAYQQDKQFDKSKEFLLTALELKKDYPLAQYNLGCVLIELNENQEALTLFSLLSSLFPENAEYICSKGDAERLLGKWKFAIKSYQNAIKVSPELARAHSNLGVLFISFGRTKEALEHCKKALILAPKELTSYINMAKCLLILEQLDEAMDVYADACDIFPDNCLLSVLIAKVWLEIKDLNEAAKWFDRALQLDNENIEALCGIATIIKDNGNSPEALERLTPLLEKEPDNIDVLSCLADTLWEDGDAEKALEHLQQLKSLQPQQSNWYARAGNILASSGSVDDALTEYNKALELNKNSISALSGLATTLRGKLNSEIAKQMEKLLHSKKLKDGGRSSLYNGLAFYHEGLKNYSQAAKLIRKANKYQWKYRSNRGWNYKQSTYEEHISKLIKCFDKDYFKKVKQFGLQDKSPVFIVGMPRSGTTLTEQIMSRHPDVLGIGERNFASQSFTSISMANASSIDRIEKLTFEQTQNIGKQYIKQLEILDNKTGLSKAKYIVDKMPDNYSLLGWIVTLFPNAKIIQCKRDLRDVALSCWMTQFGSIQWACHMNDIVLRIIQYQRIMQHWQKVLPTQIIESNYEDLVNDQKFYSKQLIEKLELEWDDKCLSFYKSEHLIRTASITQVRKPIYTSSVSRWKHFEGFFPELFEPLSL